MLFLEPLLIKLRNSRHYNVSYREREKERIAYKCQFQCYIISAIMPLTITIAITIKAIT